MKNNFLENSECQSCRRSCPALCLEMQEEVTHILEAVKSRGKQFRKGFKGSAKAFLAATSSVKSLFFFLILCKKSGDLGAKFYSSVLL